MLQLWTLSSCYPIAMKLLSICIDYILIITINIFLLKFCESQFGLCICFTFSPTITILTAFRLLGRALRGRDTSLAMTIENHPQKLGGYRFYEELLGSPKYVVAPMVDQSELVSMAHFQADGAY